ncbi:MAG: Cytochrome c oxidase assembly protein cox15 [Sclerophora amabilis]|nr:MAG: Cytochrome c oxidase assembly protein cox15 [Sclerophora amabilis]
MASYPRIFPLLRRKPPSTIRSLVSCCKCLQKEGHASRWASRHPTTSTSSSLRNVRFASTEASLPKSTFVPLKPSSSSPLGILSKSIGGEVPPAGFFPATTENSVAYWLIGSAASVFGIVVFGGLTRLTESGLSITEWRPVTGSVPPVSASDWDSEFSKYKSSPEFRLLNQHMTLPEFKKIYYMEWTHRLWGRLVGLTFVIPAAYFIARRKVSGPMSAKIVGIGGLIGLQGVLGWWMVKSGLKDDLFAPGSHPRVSQYRLTAHLGTAFLCYSAMVWNGLSILRENRLLRDPVAATKELATLRSPTLAPLRRSAGVVAGLVFLTAMSGGLVAGLDAGLIYNDFPYMGMGFTPPRSELFSDFYSRRPDGSDIWWRNMLENPSTVQLDHRILATTTFSAIMALWAYGRFGRGGAIRAAMPHAVKRGVNSVVHLVWLQVVLGISTLIYLVPVPLAAAHQASALALLTGTVVLGSRVWVPRRAARLVAEKLGARASLEKMHGIVRSPTRPFGTQNLAKTGPATLGPARKSTERLLGGNAPAATTTATTITTTT